jgi:hypothetical protein
MRIRAFAGRMTQSVKEAFKHFNLARDFMLVIMVLQLAQGLYHLATGKPQTHPHMKQAANAQKKAVEDGKNNTNSDGKSGNQSKAERKKERDQQRQLQQNKQQSQQQVAPAQSSTGLAVGAALAGGALVGSIAPMEAQQDSHAGDSAFSSTSTSFAPVDHQDTFSVSSFVASPAPAVVAEPPQALGLAAHDEQTMTTFVFGDSGSSAAAASHDPLSRSSFFSWGSPKFSDTAAVSYHSDAGYSHVTERAYDPLRR